MNYHLTLKSTNRKTGAIPVSTTSKDSCPDCPLKDNGCYAAGGPLGIHWNRVSTGAADVTDLRGLATKIAGLPEGQLWRHNQAGDLPGQGNAIDTAGLATLVDANRGKRGFTYTHKPLTSENAAAIADANARGFTINLSANNLEHADQLAASGIGPVVTLLPSSVSGNTKIATPEGRRVVVCPATYRDDVSCASCQLCSRQRDVIVGFPAHGASKAKVNTIAA